MLKMLFKDKLTTLFSLSVLGVTFSLVMGIYTGVQEYRAKSAPQPMTIPVPAMGN